MCEKAIELQLYKYERGFGESDFVYDGTKVRVIGHDFLPVEQYFKKGWRYVRYAMIKSFNPLICEQDLPTDTVDIKDGEYIIETLAQGIWLPRQDQLQKMVGKKKADVLLIDLVNWTQDNIQFYKSGVIRRLYPNASMEQLWLAFVMKEKYQKTWNGKEWEKNERS